MRLQTWFQPRGSALGHAPARPDTARPTGAARAAGHKDGALTLLSGGDATTGDLAACLELSAQYLGTLLNELELEGRLVSRKDGRVRVWSMP